ncbi:hypothetical protein [Mycolicibacterium sphagni]|uniref:hypothetical protein n=1 Tax=Mycolicibacterium sphagni TaxID=1786 RepID=UPI0021F30A37|nr:hypothetical protein [Mycolicibacterium sphagni]MCV7174928.1 hypothetical protein [Mycolicibacterium sphagni]
MTVVSATVKDVTGGASQQSWTFSSSFRHADDGSIIARSETTVSPVDGTLTVTLEPGPATVKTAGLNTVQITVPDEDCDLWDLIAGGVPPDTAPQTLAEAIAAYFEANPGSGGGSVDLSGITDLNLIRVAMGTLNDSGLSVPNVGELGADTIVTTNLTVNSPPDFFSSMALVCGDSTILLANGGGAYGCLMTVTDDSGNQTTVIPFIIGNDAVDNTMVFTASGVQVSSGMQVTDGLTADQLTVGGDVTIGTTSDPGTETPSNIGMGSSYGTNDPGDPGNVKLALWEDGSGSRYGQGVSLNALEYQVPGSATHAFFVGGALQFVISSTGIQSHADIDMAGGRIHTLSDPTDASDAATKNYIDARALTWHGAYVDAQPYTVNSVVSHDNQLWVATSDTADQPSADGTPEVGYSPTTPAAYGVASIAQAFTPAEDVVVNSVVLGFFAQASGTFTVGICASLPDNPADATFLTQTATVDNPNNDNPSDAAFAWDFPPVSLSGGTEYFLVAQMVSDQGVYGIGQDALQGGTSVGSVGSSYYGMDNTAWTSAGGVKFGFTLMGDAWTKLADTTGAVDVLTAADETAAVGVPNALSMENDGAIYLRGLVYEGNFDKNHAIRYGYADKGVDGPVINGFTGIAFYLGDANTEDENLIAQFVTGGLQIPGLTAATGHINVLVVGEDGMVTTQDRADLAGVSLADIVAAVNDSTSDLYAALASAFVTK